MPDREKACQCSCAIGRTGEDAYQDAEKVVFLTRPAPARRDAPFPMRRSRRAQRLNVPKRMLRLFVRCGLAGRPF